ncbi:MAG: AzlC family ABC transporter permease [Synergistaceae bacterium]|nr:AzlC family ABC transporter permease [Synergistaceae bacterium]
MTLKKGVRNGLPIVLGYVPIGLAYGLLGQQAHFSVWMILSLSLFVFAGSSQFIAVSMLHGGADCFAVVGTTFIVNFRHLLMAAALAPRLESWSTLRRLLMASMLTDESFAVHSMCFDRDDVDSTAAIITNAVAYLAWAASGVAGFHLGSSIVSPRTWGLDFALPAMFTGLLVPLCNSSPALTAAVCGGATAVLLHCLGFGRWAAFIGALAGATAGTASSVLQDKTAPPPNGPNDAAGSKRSSSIGSSGTRVSHG